MKKILSMALAAMLAVGSVTAYAVEAGDAVVMADGDLQVGDSFTEGDLKYTVLDDGTLEVSCPDENRDKLTEVTIPFEVNGKSVTSIGMWAFENCTSLTSVTIPEGVTSIGDGAFESCTSLTSVTIPGSVTSIGFQAFRNCRSLTSVTIPDSVTYIATESFSGCTSLTTVTIPDSITVIGMEAFFRCTSLTTVTIPDSITSIGSMAFFGCTGLTTVTIPDSITSIGSSVFASCTSLTSIDVNSKNEYYCSIDGVLFNKGKTQLIQYPAGRASKNYSIPDSVTSIESRAFRSCASLTTVTIPDSASSIGEYAFQLCTSLTSVTIPNGVTSIEKGTFYDCASLAKVTIPDSVTSIVELAFCHCTSLTSVTLPNSITSIKRSAFYGCTSLTEMTIPDSVTSIGSSVFSYCTSLTSINIDSQNEYYCSVDGILFNKGKTQLIQYPAGRTSKSYTLPDSVTGIEAEAFSGCTNLTSIDVNSKNEYYCSVDGVLFNKSKTRLFQCPAGRTSKNYTIPDSVTSIRLRAFHDCTSLVSVTIPDSVTSIEYQAFDGCTNLKYVYYSGTEEEWGKINIGEKNESLIIATIHYNSTGPVLTPVKIDIAKPESGNAPDTSGMKAEVANSGEKLQTITIGEDGKLNIAGIADGEYSFTFSANNCAPRAYDVTVAGSTITGLEDGVELHLYGDLDGDGKVNMKDVGKANAHAKNTAKLSDYDLSVCDINGDGKINMQDVGLMNAHAKNTKSLWK